MEPASTVLLASTAPTASAALHASLKADQVVRSYAAVHFNGPTPIFGDIRTVPAALVPPLPNAGGVRGGRASYAAQHGTEDFAFDYGLAFFLRQTEAFARNGFGTACMGSTCHGKNPVYTQGQEPFMWERKRNRGGALICHGAGGHLLCLRCVDADYEAGRPFVTSATGAALPRKDLFAKFEVFPRTKELRQAQSGEPAEDGGHQFFVQRRDIATCSHCNEPNATSKRGVKRALGEEPTPCELGSVAILGKLARSKILPTAVAPGLFLVPLLGTSNGCLLDIQSEGGLGNVPRLVKIDHTGKFECVCGQRACRDHEMRFLEETRFMNGWWQGGFADFTAFDESRSFVRQITSGVPWVLPFNQRGRIGAALLGPDAEAWAGGLRVRIFVICERGERSVVCVLAGETSQCSHADCSGPERCRHLLKVLAKPDPLVSERVAGGAQNGKRQNLTEWRAERLSQRETGVRRITVCNHTVCRRPEF